MPLTVLTDADVRELRAMQAWFRGFRAEGLRNLPGQGQVTLSPTPGIRGPVYRPHLNIGPIMARFLAAITGSASLATGRFKYAWSEIYFTGTTYAVVDGGRSGTTTANYALSALEYGHTATYQGGVDVTGTDYAATGMEYRPVGGGGSSSTHRYDVPVEMLYVLTAEATIQPVFFGSPGSHDGPCTAP